MRYVIIYWLLIITGCIWAFVEILSGEAFDALVLFIMTYTFHSYRKQILKVRKDALWGQRDKK